jgi:hypothetical protein
MNVNEIVFILSSIINVTSLILIRKRMIRMNGSKESGDFFKENFREDFLCENKGKKNKIGMLFGEEPQIDDVL